MRGGSDEARQVAAATRALARIPASATAQDLFDAIRSCAPAAAGILGVIRPGVPGGLVSHAVRLSPDVLESWLRTPAEVLARTLAPVILSPDGGLSRDSEALTGALREELDVLRRLDTAGLGEGFGYKIMKRAAAWGGEEHFMLALIAERGEIIPPRSAALLAALNPAIREAVQRLGLPLLARASIFQQIVEEQSLGYACVTLGGAVLEANRRAHELAFRYRVVAGIDGRRRALPDLAARARSRAAGGQTWRIEATDPPSALEVNAHRLARETHALPEDVILVVMRESFALGAGASTSHVLSRLTSRQQQIALLVARTALSYKEIADRLELREGTVYKHAENIHRLLGVRTRAELVVLLR